jgi:hypothetical protein
MREVEFKHRYRPRRPRHATVVAYLALFFCLSGTAWAVTDSGGARTTIITACVAKQSGAVRIVHAGDRCGRAARKLVWNQRGVTGPTGAPGTNGPRGPQGPAGAVDTSHFYTKQQADARYLSANGTAADAAQLGGSPASAFASSHLFGSPVTTTSQVGGYDPDCVVGEVRLYAGDHDVLGGWALADGRTLPISDNLALFAVLGTTYGGDGVTNFALPNLVAASPKGDGPAGVNYYVCTVGIFP